MNGIYQKYEWFCVYLQERQEAKPNNRFYFYLFFCFIVDKKVLTIKLFHQLSKPNLTPFTHATKPTKLSG